MKKIIVGALFVSFALSMLVIQNNKPTEEFKISKGFNFLEVQRRGCCSWHGGVDGCSDGRVVCRDGSLSPSCTCYSDVNPLKGC